MLLRVRQHIRVLVMTQEIINNLILSSLVAGIQRRYPLLSPHVEPADKGLKATSTGGRRIAISCAELKLKASSPPSGGNEKTAPQTAVPRAPKFETFG